MIQVIEKLLTGLSKAGIHPNLLTILGTLLQCLGGWLLFQGYWFACGLYLCIVCPLDMLDGALAKRTGQVTGFGAFLDSTLDRIADMALFGGIAGYYAFAGNTPTSLLAFYCLITAVLISYSKARAENLISDCTVGLAQRPERTVLLIASCVFGCMKFGLGIIAFYNTLTAVQRIRHTWLLMHNRRPSLFERALYLDFGRTSWTYRILAGLTLAVMLLAGILIRSA